MSYTINIPIFRDYKEIMSPFCSTLESQEEKFNIEYNHWEISVPKKNDLIWAIILPYLMERAQENPDTFHKCLCKVTDIKKNAAGKVQSCVKFYNPFWNRGACFHNDELNALVIAFEKRLSEFVKCKKNKKFFENQLKKEEKMVQAASHILQCRIVEVIHSSDTRGHYWNIQHHLAKEQSGDISEIILYKEETNKSRSKAYSFGMAKDMASKMQKKALHMILRENFNTKDIGEIFLRSEDRRNLIGELLHQKRTKDVKKLLSAPPRILLKLLEAGFPTDLSAAPSPGNIFFLALCSQDEELLYLLYKHFINTSTWSEFSIRESSLCVVETLRELSTALTDAQNQYKSHKPANTNVLISARGLYAFHLFLKELSQSVCHAKQWKNYSKSIPIDQYEAEGFKDIVLTILKVYSFYFQLDCIEEAPKLKMNQYEKFFSYFTSFRFLDTQAAVFFFDHCFALKNKVKFPEKDVHEMETAFARYFFLSKYYYGILNSQKRVSKANSPDQLQTFRLTYLERLGLKQKIDAFQEKLSDTIIDESNIICQINASDVHTLEKEPVIKDEMILICLEHYMDLAINVNLEAEPEVGVVAIERGLQVIGESLVLEEYETPTLAKSLVMSCLDEVTKKDLVHIRNMLIHGDRKAFANRIKIENDIEFFRNIQKDLKKLKNRFSHIFELQSLRMQKYALKSGIGITNNEIKQLKLPNKERVIQKGVDAISNRHLKVAEQMLFTNDNSLETQPKEWINDVNKRFKKVLKGFQNQNKNLWQILNENEEKMKQMLRVHFELYKNHFQNHFSWFTSQGEEAWSKSVVDTHIKTMEKLWRSLSSTKNFLVFLAKKLHGEEENVEGEEENDLLRQVKELKTEVGYEEISNILSSFGSLAEKIFAELKNSKNIENHEVRFKDRMVNHSQWMASEEENRTYKTLKQWVRSMKTLLEFFAEEYSYCSIERGEMINKIRKLEAKVKGVEIFTFLKELENLGRKMFGEITVDNNMAPVFSDVITHVQKFRSILQGGSYFSQPVINQIKNAVPEEHAFYIPEDKSLEYFHTRIEKLKNATVKRYPDVNHLWEKGRSIKTREFTRDKLVKHCLKEPLVQAAVEQLILDCADVLKKDHQWLKTNYLFNGIMLRSILAHCNPLSECVSPMLDPCDIPNELITKVFELFDEYNVIFAVIDLEKAIVKDKRRRGVKENGVYFNELEEVVMSDKNDTYKDLSNTIKKVDNWRDYITLVKRWHKVSEPPVKPDSEDNKSDMDIGAELR